MRAAGHCLLQEDELQHVHHQQPAGYAYGQVLLARSSGASPVAQGIGVHAAVRILFLEPVRFLLEELVQGVPG